MLTIQKTKIKEKETRKGPYRKKQSGGHIGREKILLLIAVNLGHFCIQ